MPSELGSFEDDKNRSLGRLQDIESQISYLVSSDADMAEKIAGLRKLSTEVGSVKRDLERRFRKFEENTARLITLHADLSASQQKESKSLKRIYELEAKQREAGSVQKSLEIKINSIQKQVDEAQKAREIAERKYSEIIARNSELENSMTDRATIASDLEIARKVMESMDANNEQLERQHTELRKEYETLNDDFTATLKQFRDLNEKMNKSQSEREFFEKSLREAQTALSEADRKANDYRIKFEKVCREKEDFGGNLEQIEEEAREYKTKNAELEKLLEEVRATLALAEKNHQEREQALSADLEQNEKTLEKLSEELSGLRRRHDDSQEKCRTFENELAAAERGGRDLADKNGSLAEKIEEQDVALEALGADKDALKKDLKAMTERYDEESVLRSRLLLEYENLLAEKDAFAAEWKIARKEADQLRDNLATARDERDELKIRSESLSVEIEKKLIELSSSEIEARSLKTELEKKTGEISDLRALNGELESEIEVAKKAKLSVDGELAEAKSDIEQRDEKLNLAHVKIEEIEGSLSDEIARSELLEKELVETVKMNESLALELAGARDDVFKLNSKIKIIDQELADAQTRCDELSLVVEDGMEEKKTLVGQIDLLEGRIEESDRNFEALAKLRESLENELNVTITEKEKTSEELTHAKNLIKKLNDELLRTHQELADAQTRCDELSLVVEDGTEEKKTLVGQIDLLEGRIEESDRNFEALAKLRESLENELNVTITEKEKTSEELTRANNLINSLNDELSQAHQELADVHARCDNLTVQIADDESKNRQLQEDLSSASSKLEETSAGLAEHRAEAIKYRERLAISEELKNKAEEELAEKRQEVAELTTQLSALDESLAELEEQNRTSKTRATTLEDSLKVLQTEINILREEEASLIQLKENITAECEMLKSEKSELEKERDLNRSELKDLRVTKSEKEKLDLKLEDIKKEHSNLKQQLAGAESELVRIRGAFAVLESERDDLKGSLHMKNRDFGMRISELQENIQKYAVREAELLTENRRLRAAEQRMQLLMKERKDLEATMIKTREEAELSVLESQNLRTELESVHRDLVDTLKKQLAQRENLIVTQKEAKQLKERLTADCDIIKDLKKDNANQLRTIKEIEAANMELRNFGEDIEARNRNITNDLNNQRKQFDALKEKYHLSLDKILEMSRQIDVEISSKRTEESFVHREPLKNTFKYLFGKRHNVGEMRHVIALEHQIENALKPGTLSLQYFPGEALRSHSYNVAILSIAMGRALGLSPKTVELLGVGGLVHDVGLSSLHEKDEIKLLTAAPDRVIGISEHPFFGAKILQRIPGINPLLVRIIYEHHERINGSGYPTHLEGRKVHPLSQIMGLAEYYDRLTARWLPKEQRISSAEALKIIAAEVEKNGFSTHLLAPLVQALRQ